jgi:hypothetical protein
MAADAEYDTRLKIFVTNLSKRAIRKRPDDESEAFARWVGRTPIAIGFTYKQEWYDTGSPMKVTDSGGEVFDFDWRW